MTFNPVPKPKNYCRCGCGKEIPINRKWVSGHNLKTKQKDVIVKNGRTYKHIRCSKCYSKIIKRTDLIKNKNYCDKCSKGITSERKFGKILHNARKGEYRNCLVCNNEFYLSPSQIKQSAKFCSQKCRLKNQKDKGVVPENFISSTNNKGKNNGRYKHGKRIGGNVSKMKLRKKVIDRDGGNWCLFCGKPGPGLHLHRIKYGAQGGKYELNNCVQLCPVHHELVHSNKRIWKPILEKYIETGKFDKDIFKKEQD